MKIFHGFEVRIEKTIRPNFEGLCLRRLLQNSNPTWRKRHDTGCLIIYATIYRRYTIFMKAHVDARNM